MQRRKRGDLERAGVLDLMLLLVLLLMLVLPWQLMLLIYLPLQLPAVAADVAATPGGLASAILVPAEILGTAGGWMSEDHWMKPTNPSVPSTSFDLSCGLGGI